MRKGFTQVDLDMGMGTKMWGNTRVPGAVWVGDEPPTEEEVAKEECLYRLATKFQTVTNSLCGWWNRPVTVTAADIVAHEELSLCGKILREHVKANSIMLVEVPACECGVAITGGLHSDWCPLKDTNG